MRLIFLCFLLGFILPVFGQQEEVFNIHKPGGFHGNSLYYALTPAGDVYADSTYTYLLFLPEKKVCWFLSAVPPEAQNPVHVTGMIAGTCEYYMAADTIRFARSFSSFKGFDSGEDKFTCIITTDGMKAMMEEYIGNVLNGEALYFLFKQFKKEK